MRRKRSEIGGDANHRARIVRLPEVDGIELLRELAEGGRRAQIVLASGVDSRTLRTARRINIQTGAPIRPP